MDLSDKDPGAKEKIYGSRKGNKADASIYAGRHIGATATSRDNLGSTRSHTLSGNAWGTICILSSLIYKKTLTDGENFAFTKFIFTRSRLKKQQTNISAMAAFFWLGLLVVAVLTAFDTF